MWLWILVGIIFLGLPILAYRILGISTFRRF